MTQTPSSLSPDQKSLQAVALRQLQDVLTTLERLRAITIEQADMEAVLDARENVNAAVEILQHWYGTEPELTDDGTEG
jgi:hypothetical protein